VSVDPSLRVFEFANIPWDDPMSSLPPDKRPPAELVAKARASGTRRKRIVRGEAGFFMNRSEMGPGFRVPPHRHDHDELLVVLRGGCAFDDGQGELREGDSIVIRANTSYGFTCGSEGMDFLTIRQGEARVELEPPR